MREGESRRFRTVALCSVIVMTVIGLSAVLLSRPVYGESQGANGAPALSVTNTASPSFTRTYKWSMLMTCEQPTQGGYWSEISCKLDISTHSAMTDYDVLVTSSDCPVGCSTPAYVDSGWSVNGTITVTNRDTVKSFTTTVSDKDSVGGACSIGASNGFAANGNGTITGSIAANASLTFSYACTYSSAPSSSNGMNSAMAVWSTGTTTGTHAFSFETPTTNVNSVVTVTDTLGGSFRTCSNTSVWDGFSSTCYLHYQYTLTGGQVGSCVTQEDTATIAETGQNGSATVKFCATVPNLTISPTAGASGTTVTLSGNGYAQDHTYNYCFEPNTASPHYCTYLNFVTDGDGEILPTVTLPVFGPVGTTGQVVVTDASNTTVVTHASFAITSKGTTTTTVECNYPTVAEDTQAACTAFVSGYPPTGTVSWKYGGTGSVSFISSRCTLSFGYCTATIVGSKVGTVTITATYSGSSYNLGSSGEAALIITKASTETTISCTRPTFPSGSSIVCTATVTGAYSSHTGTIAWSTVSGPGRVTLSMKTCTLKAGKCSVTVKGMAAGSVTIEASYSGDSNNTGSSGTHSFTIN